jgi:hypothetical protein
LGIFYGTVGKTILLGFKNPVGFAEFETYRIWKIQQVLSVL